MAERKGLEKHARDLYEVAKRYAHIGMNDAEYLLTATARAARLHLTMRRNQIAKHRILHSLGRELWQSLPAESDAREIRVTNSMRAMVREIEALDEEARRAQQEAELISVVRRDEPPRR